MDDIVFNAETDNLTDTIITINGYHIFENVVLSMTGILIIGANVLLFPLSIYGMYRRRITRKRFLFVANLSFADLILGISLTILNFAIISFRVRQGDSVHQDQVNAFFIIVYGSVILTITTNMFLSIAQYIALTRPLVYKCDFRLRHVFMLIGFSWILAIAFSGSMQYFWSHRTEVRHLEVTHICSSVVIALGIIGNGGLNFYVTYIAFHNLKKQQNVVSDAKASKSSVSSNTAKASAMFASRERSQALFANALTLLLRVCGNIITYTPLLCVILYEFIAGEEPFEEDMTAGLVISVLFFVRSFSDAAISLIRERRLWTAAGCCQGGPKSTSTGTTATSVIMSEY